MNFDDLVGQEHVATTLANAIAINRVAHAFLFTGVRGVGKTTSARILAKALNCEKGPTAKPCLVCSPCLEIAAGMDLDVQEIDAASRTGVDDIRELQERLVYRPQRDRFRVYIVDEVHMLSQSAWNAFLKTLEEPPPHVKFIFATTEVNKVPVTILSRCQRYDFKLIALSVLAARLRFVLKEEGIAADDGAIQILAREAAGSMRDAMSLLDQVIAWAGEGGSLTSQGVSKALGVADGASLHRIARAVMNADAAAALTVVGELADSGFDIGHLARDFLAVLRDLVVAKVAPEARALITVPDSELGELVAIAGLGSTDDLTRLHLAFSRACEDILESPAPRASFEMALVRLARRPQLLPIDELVRRLADMEQRLEGGGQSGSTPTGPARPEPPRDPNDRSGAVRPSGSAAAAAARPRPRPSEPSDDPEPAASPAAPPAAASPPTEAELDPPLAPERPTPPPASLPPASSPPPRAAPASVLPGSPGAARSVPASALRPSTFLSGRVAVLDVAHPGFAELAAFVEAVRPRSARIASLLERAALVDANSQGLIIGFDARSFEAGLLSDPETQALLASAAGEHFPAGASVELADVAIGPEVPTLAKLVNDAAQARRAEVDSELRSHPLVRAALEHLGAELRDVRLPKNVDASPISLDDARARNLAQRQ